MKIKLYGIMSDAIDTGIQFGINRFNKHRSENYVHDEDRDALLNSIHDEVMNSLCNIFSFDDEEVERCGGSDSAADSLLD